MRFNYCGYRRPRYAYAYAGSAHRPFTSSKPYETRRHGGSFGVRRPLRYLSYRLDLDEEQVRRIAAILDVLKTEREQAALDEARTVTEIATLVPHQELTVDALREALAPRVAAAERMQLAVARAANDIADALDDDQRHEFAYLLNAKSFSL